MLGSKVFPVEGERSSRARW